jgi:alpha-tubulin suppressor-like RCC1 family protein
MKDNSFQELGRSSSLIDGTPGAITQTTVLAGKTILKWSAGFRHVILIMSDNNLYGWGANDVCSTLSLHVFLH